MPRRQRQSTLSMMPAQRSDKGVLSNASPGQTASILLCPDMSNCRLSAIADLNMLKSLDLRAAVCQPA